MNERWSDRIVRVVVAAVLLYCVVLAGMGLMGVS